MMTLAWQSGFEHFLMTPERNANSEPAIIPTDSEDNLQNVAQDADPVALPENQPDQQEIQPVNRKSNPKTTLIQDLVPPGKESTTFVANSLQIGKATMLTTTLWSLTQANKLLIRNREMVLLILT